MAYIPTATYRLQLSQNFTLEQLQPVIDYLHKLGVSTLYGAPFFKAQEGSTHGYDVTDPTRLNPAIGSADQLQKIAARLKEKKMGWLQDIVPNHMAYGTQNNWLMDVLEKGPHSEWYPYFDFWNELTPESDEKQIMTPFLGSSLDECLQKREIKLSAKNGKCFVNYYDNAYPLSLPAYALLLRDTGDDDLKKALDTAKKLEKDYDPQNEEQLRSQLAAADKSLQQYFSGYEKDPDQLKSLLDAQYYRLCWWKETEKHINYRRFFTVNDLICLNIQDPEVFKGYHRYIKELLEQGVVQGLRVDHIDGLYDPEKYLKELRQLAGPDAYLLVEKILEGDEILDQQLPIQGTTGYDFLAALNALFANRGAEQDLTRLYEEISNSKTNWDDLVWNNKKLILHERMEGEFNNLLKLYYKAVQQQQAAAPELMAEALSCFLLSFPVYRTYINGYPFREEDKEILQATFDKAEKRISQQAETALRELKDFFSSEGKAGTVDNKLLFINRMQQISGPLQAKGLEDTTFYMYNRLLSLNEVGSQPQHLGIETATFHRLLKRRQQTMPHTLNCTATHDTKRGEDARQRLNALSEMPDRWEKTVKAWLELNKDKKKEIEGQPAPDRNDEYFIYQSLLAFYPAEGVHDADFVERLQPYMQKALREAKRHSNWSSPNTAYEEATEDFINQLLTNDAYLQSFRPLAKDLARAGILKSLSQLLIKMLAPGVPDIYQGTELPDLSMVDPDNRREVNYRQREEWLDQLLEAEPKGPDQLHLNLLEHATDGRIKLFLTHKFLIFRRQYPDLCSKGAYIPVEVIGKHQGKVLAFARLQEGAACLVVAPLYPAMIATEPPYLPTEADWGDTHLVIPDELPDAWTDIITSAQINVEGNRRIPLASLLRQLPLALLKGGKV